MNICINVLPNQVIKYKKRLALLEIGIEFSIQNPQKGNPLRTIHFYQELVRKERF